MKRKIIEIILISTIIFCALLIIGILGYVFKNKEPNFPDNVLILPYRDKSEIKVEYI